MRAALPFVVSLACALTVVGRGHARETMLDSKLRAFLQTEFAKDDAAGFTTRAAVAKANLTKAGPPVFAVYLMGNSWCGSGGCTLALIQPQGASFKVMSRTALE